MRRVLLVFLANMSICAVAVGQHGTAESGYWPFGYNGDTWTGEVTAVNESTREITLVYRDAKHKKSQTFVAELPQGYKTQPKDQAPHELKLSEIPIGTRVKVYYIERSRKVGGVKTKYNEIIRIVSAPLREK
jgi:hypothetical protein